jgi:transcriptional regulator with XRE-family HTH domain
LQIVELGGYPAGVPTFGENLKRLRDARGWSQEALARKLNQKRPGTVQSWEKARRAPRMRSLQRLAAALECDVTELLDGVNAVYGPIEDAGLTRTVRRGLKLLQSMNGDGQKLAVALIAGIAAAYPREASPESSVTRPRRTVATARTTRDRPRAG